LGLKEPSLSLNILHKKTNRKDAAMIHYKNVKIYSVDVDETYYDKKKKKHIKYAKPKVTKKLLFEENYIFDLGELYIQIKNSHDRSPYKKIEVSFETELEY
jgi:hypothetical protein